MALSGSAPSSRRVNDLLANSRAEHARHVQNLARAARLPPPTPQYGRTLPFLLPTPPPEPAPPPTEATTSRPPPPKKPAGPPPPRSWVRPSPPSSQITDLLSPTAPGRTERARLLAPTFQHLFVPWDVSHLPSLVDYCLLSLLTPFDTDTVSSLPAHLRQRLVRLSSIHRPLSRSELSVCWGEDYSGTGGEALILGRDSYTALKQLLHALQAPNFPPPPEDSWDTPLHLLSNPPVLPVLHTLVLLRTPLPSPSLLPRTLTHLAVIRCTLDPIRTARQLPKVLPLLEWLEVRGCEGLERVWFEGLEWGRWRGLRGVRLGLAEGEGRAEVLGEEGEESLAERERRRLETERELERWKERVRRRVEHGRVGEVEISFD